MISHFSGSSSTQSLAGAEDAVVFQLYLPCYCHVAPSSPSVMMYSRIFTSHAALFCFCHTVVVFFLLVTLCVFHKPRQCTTKNVTLVPNLRIVIGIMQFMKLYLTWIKKLFPVLPFYPSGITVIVHTQRCITLILTVQQHRLIEGFNL